MYRHVAITLISAAFLSPLQAGDNTFLDYQNYNHGYCPDCNNCPCDCPSTSYKSCPQEEGNCSEAPVYNPNIQPCYPCEEPSGDCVGQDPKVEHKTCEQNECAEDCPPCDPCAPVCSAESGFSVCAMGLGLAAIGAGVAVIVVSNNGASEVGHN